MKRNTALCPSARCEEGASLLGVVMPDGRIAFAQDRLVVDRVFVDAARGGRAPERRFRFSNMCVRGACQQWTGQHCGAIERAVEKLGDEARGLPLPRCSIRPQCRWYHQRGRRACQVCPLVITDIREDGRAGG